MPRTSRTRADGHQEADVRVARPERAQPLELLGERRGRSDPLRPRRRCARCGPSRRCPIVAEAWARKASRKAIDAAPARSPARRRHDARRNAPRCSEQARSPSSRSYPGTLRPEPRPRPSESSEITIAGFRWRSARREATIPITPGCQPRPARTIAPASRSWSGSSESAALAAASTSRSVCRRSPLARSSSAAISTRPVRRSSGEEQLDPRVGSVEPPGGVDPRRQAEGQVPLVEARGLTAARPRSGPASRGALARRASSSPRRTSERFSPSSGTRSATVARATRSRSTLGRGRIAAERLPQARGQLPGDRRPAQLGERISAQRRVEDRAVGELGTRLVMVGDDHLHPPLPRPGDRVDRGDRAVDGEDQRGAALGERIDTCLGEPIAVADPVGDQPVAARPPARGGRRRRSPWRRRRRRRSRRGR